MLHQLCFLFHPKSNQHMKETLLASSYNVSGSIDIPDKVKDFRIFLFEEAPVKSREKILCELKGKLTLVA